MSGAIPATAFQSVVARYERSGWDVRTINHATLRATVHTSGADPGALPGEPRVKSPDRTPACRKLWVDAQGQVQETDVPC